MAHFTGGGITSVLEMDLCDIKLYSGEAYKLYKEMNTPPKSP